MRRALTLALLSGSLLPCCWAQETAVDRDYAAGQRALASGDVNTAMQLFHKVSAENPRLAEVHATMGAILFQQGRYAEALKELHEAKRLKPMLPKLESLIAMAEAESGNVKEALPKLEETFRSAKDDAVRRMSGLQLERAYTELRQDSDAVRVALELQRMYPNDAEVLYHNERIFGNYAYLTAQRLASVAPDSVWRLQAQAEAQESQGSLDAAIAAYQQILVTDPRHRGIHYRIGRCLRERARTTHHPEDLVSAMTEFQDELTLNPDNADAAYEIGELHRLAGELEPARNYFERAVKIYPTFPEANLGLGTVLASLGEPAMALPHLQTAVAADPTAEASWYRLSQVERALGDKAGQQRASQEFIKLHNQTATGAMAPLRDVSRQEVDTDSPE
jgi:tetratricopeptide (TPR) repeat protein